MTLLFFAHTLDVLGKILLGITVIRVHWRMAQEHCIDPIVIRSIKRERVLGLAGIAFIIIGYLIVLYLEVA